MLSVNPFSDPEIKKQILEDSGVTPLGDDVSGQVDFSDFQNIIDTTPVIPGKEGKAIKTIIKDASAVLKDNQEAKAQQLNVALSDIMTKYNETYNLDLKINFNNFSKTLVACSDERSQKILELYVSKVVRGLRPIILLNLISKLSLALDYILDPARMFKDLTLTDVFLAVDQILNYMEKIEALRDSILIENEGLELKRLAEENGLEYQEGDQELVENFMKMFKKDNGIQ